MISSYGQSVQSLRVASKGMYAGPAISLSVLDQAMRSIEGLDTQQIRRSARTARGRSQSRGARSLVKTLGELVLHVGMNMVSSELHRLVRSWWEEQRSADEVTEDTQDGTDAIDTVDEQCMQSVETVLSQLQVAIAALSAALGALHPVLHAPVFQALVRSGAGVIDAAGSHVLGLCESRDKAVEQCLEKMVDHCRQRCEQPEQPPAKAVGSCESAPRDTVPRTPEPSKAAPAQQTVPSAAAQETTPAAAAQQTTPSAVAQQTAPAAAGQEPAQQMSKEWGNSPTKAQQSDLVEQLKHTKDALKQEENTCKEEKADQETEPARQEEKPSKQEGKSCEEQQQGKSSGTKDTDTKDSQASETQSEDVESDECVEQEQAEEQHEQAECEEGTQFSGVLGLLGVGVIALGIGWVVQQISEHLGQWWEQLQQPPAGPVELGPVGPVNEAPAGPVEQAPVDQAEPPPNPLKQNVKYAAPAPAPAPAPVQQPTPAPAQEPVHSSGPAPKKAGSW